MPRCRVIVPVRCGTYSVLSTRYFKPWTTTDASDGKFQLRLLRQLVLLLIVFSATIARAENWPRWRGPEGNAVSRETGLPIRWSTTENVRWKIKVPGEGGSSPIVWDDAVFLTSSLEHGTRRSVHCFDRQNGTLRWSREIRDPNPEITSALAGHAAATPVTDGKHVIAMFGNAGAVCYGFDGRLLWRRPFGEFESELGFASSPILFGDAVILVCDHDGSRFSTFDSFLTALDLNSGEVRWKTERPGLFRSWSTPIVVPAGKDQWELVVNAQDELRGYDPQSGQLLWQVRGMTGWVTPSPVFGHGMIFATSGKDGPTMAVKPDGRGDVTETHVVWQQRRGAPYVCSPLLYGDHLFVHNEQGVLTCFAARTGEQLSRKRLEGKFTASGVAAEGRLYLTNDAGETFVLEATPQLRLIARNALDEEVLASPAVSAGTLFLRTQTRLYCLGRRVEDSASGARRPER